MNWIVLLISITCYILAPKGYDYSFIILLFSLFCFQFFIYLRRHKKEQLINFHVLFLLSSFIVVYLYPIFIHPTGISFIRHLCDGHINKGTALAQASISAFLFGVSLINNKYKSYNKIADKTFKEPKILILLLYISIISTVMYYIPLIGTAYGAINKNDTLVSLVLILFTILIIVQSHNNKLIIDSLSDFIRVNRNYVLAIMFLCVILLVVGIRFAVLSILLVVLLSYISYSNKINYKLIIGAGALVLLTFFVVMITRNGGDMTDYNISTDNGLPRIFYMLSDLIGISNNLYAGIEYVENNGILYGSSIIPQVFAPIPFLPTLLTEFMYGTNTTAQTTQFILSDYLGTVSAQHTYFVGTNCFIDIYMNFGFLLTIIAFTLFGYFVQKIHQQKDYSIYYQYIYFILVSDAIFMTRGTLYSCYRPIVWGLVIIYFIIKQKKEIII